MTKRTMHGDGPRAAKIRTGICDCGCGTVLLGLGDARGVGLAWGSFSPATADALARDLMERARQQRSLGEAGAPAAARPH